MSATGPWSVPILYEPLQFRDQPESPAGRKTPDLGAGTRLISRRDSGPIDRTPGKRRRLPFRPVLADFAAPAVRRAGTPLAQYRRVGGSTSERHAQSVELRA